MYGRAALILASLPLFAGSARAAPPKEEVPPHAAPPHEQALPRAPRATLVEVLRGGKQVLVLDRASGDYAVLKVGDSIQGFRITSIEDDQIVLLGVGAPERHFVLPLFDKTPLPPMKAPVTGAGEPVDPYATASTPAPAPGDSVLDPYGPAEIPAVVAPEKSRADSTPPPAPTSAPAAAASPTPTPTPIDPAPAAAETSPAPSATPAPAAKPQGEKRRLSRKELNKALSDFAALSREIKIERAAGGGVLVTDLAKGSFVARLGIEKGDLVRRVAGHAIDTVDDAAGAYAAVVSAKQVVVDVERHGARLQITYQLTD